VISPVELPTDAIPELLLVHIPPVEASEKVVVDVWQTELAPVIGAGEFVTTADDVIKHPVDNIYVIVTGPPDIPDIIPVDDPTAIIAELELVHVPPKVALLKVLVVLMYRLVDPEITAGDELTVIVVVVEQPEASV